MRLSSEINHGVFRCSGERPPRKGPVGYRIARGDEDLTAEERAGISCGQLRRRLILWSDPGGRGGVIVPVSAVGRPAALVANASALYEATVELMRAARPKAAGDSELQTAIDRVGAILDQIKAVIGERTERFA